MDHSLRIPTQMGCDYCGAIKWVDYYGANPLSDELAAAMADFLFDLAQNFENTFYTQIRRHYDHRQSEWHQRRGSVPGEKEGSITEQSDAES